MFSYIFAWHDVNDSSRAVKPIYSELTWKIQARDVTGIFRSCEVWMKLIKFWLSWTQSEL